MRSFGMILIVVAVLLAALIAFTTVSVDLGYRIGGGTFEQVSEPCGSVFGILVLDNYDTAVQGERPPQAQAIDPDGSSLREQCELVAKTRLLTWGSIAAVMAVAGFVLMRVGDRRQKPMQDLRPLPRKDQ